jgi:hypothetical protein
LSGSIDQSVASTGSMSASTDTASTLTPRTGQQVFVLEPTINLRAAVEEFVKTNAEKGMYD